MATNDDYELERLLYLRRIEAMDHHLNFMQYTWQNHSEPFVVGYHTRKICAAIDYAMELYRDGKSSAWVITVPFRHGKSEILSRKLPAHFLGLFPDSKVILCGHTQALTEGFSKTSRNLISTPEFKKLFPNLRVDPSSSSGAHWNIKDHEGECFASGLLGSLSGQGYNLGLLDDFCRNRADAESETMREKMWDAFTNDFMTRKAPVSITIVLATPWHVDDIIGRIKKKVKDDPDFPRFNFLSFPAISEDYRDGVLFPERFGKQWYTQQKAVLGDYGFQSLMQLEPVKRSGNMLNTECIQRHLSTADWPKNLRWMRVWDLAHTAKERAKAVSMPKWIQILFTGFVF